MRLKDSLGSTSLNITSEGMLKLWSDDYGQYFLCCCDFRLAACCFGRISCLDTYDEIAGCSAIKKTGEESRQTHADRQSN